jgi:hypothetical protein
MVIIPVLDTYPESRCPVSAFIGVTLSHLPVSSAYRFAKAPGIMEGMGKLHQHARDQLPTVRNILITCGAFWLSLWTVAPLVWLFSKLNDKVIYGDSVVEAVAMGAMTSMGPSFGAILAGLLVTFTADGRKPERWALAVATLYVIDAPVRHHWHLGPTPWDRIWQTAELVVPGTCLYWRRDDHAIATRDSRRDD